jgi:hypothetical protein
MMGASGGGDEIEKMGNVVNGGNCVVCRAYPCRGGCDVMVVVVAAVMVTCGGGGGDCNGGLERVVIAT